MHNSHRPVGVRRTDGGWRFADLIYVTEETNPTQIGHYRPGDGRAWAAYWHHGLVYVADNVRGVDILRLTRR
jgi:hypothetical protein